MPPPQASTPARILLVDDHEVVRRGMAALLDGRDEWRIVGEADNGRYAVVLALELQPDIIIMDIALPELNGFEATRQILRVRPRIEVLVLSMHDGDQVIREVIAAGARGYVLKSDAGRHLVEAVEALAAHRPFFTTRIAAKLYQDARLPPKRGRPAAPGITRREREVLQLLAEGCSNREVGDRLGISVKTAETHRFRMMRKLEAKSLADLVRYALRAGIAASN